MNPSTQPSIHSSPIVHHVMVRWAVGITLVVTIASAWIFIFRGALFDPSEHVVLTLQGNW